jgi:cytochrome c553
MKTWILVGFLTLFGAGALAAEEMPAQAQACVACHGKEGVSGNPEWPNLAGQNAGYLAAQLTAFREGRRDNPAMAPFVAGLSDGDIAVLSEYYSGLDRAITANGDPTLVGKGENLSAYCKACHGMQGVPATPDWPILAGQQAPYLLKQLLAYKSGTRVNSHMAAAIARFDEPEFRALAAYYSQLAP